MIKTTQRWLLAGVFAFALLQGCSKSEDEEQAAATAEYASASGAGLLKYVPADSPYVFAVTEGLPKSVRDKFEPGVNELLASYRKIALAAIAEGRQQAQDGEGPDEDKLRGLAVAEEMTSLLSLDGLRSVGLTMEATTVIYGSGLVPVMRLNLTDGTLFEDAIERMEAKAGEKMMTAEVGGKTYRYAGDENARVLLAVFGDELVVSVVPSSLSEQGLKSVLGLELPPKSIADSGELTAIAKAQGFLPQGTGFIDIRRIASIFLDQQSGSNREILALMEYEGSELSDACRTEIRAMSEVAPRLLAGYTALDAQRMATNMIFELREDLAAAVSKLVAPVPGLGSEKAGLFSLGMSIDLVAARQFMFDRIAAMEANPYKCEHFADLQNGLAQAKQALNQPIPPVAYSFKGMNFVFEGLGDWSLESGQPPKNVDARALLAIDNPASLLAMGQMFVPALASIQLEPDGKVVKLDSGTVPGLEQTLFVAMTDKALALSVGDGLEDKLPGMLNAQAADPLMFLSADYDMAAYYNFIGGVISMAKDEEGEDSLDAEIANAASNAATVFSDVVDRTSIDIIPTAQGLEMSSTVTFK